MTANIDEQRLDEQREKRYAQSNAYLERGQLLLARAADLQFREPELLHKAYAAFQRAVALNRRDPAARIELARFLYMIDLPDLAQQHFLDAKAIDPEHELVKEHQEYLENSHLIDEDVSRVFSVLSFAEISKPKSENQYDDLYDSAEDFIEREIRTLQQRNVGYEPTIDPELFAQQNLFYTELSTVIEVIETKLKVLSEDLEVDSLQAELKPLLQMQMAMEKGLKHSYQLALLDEHIKTTYDRVTGCFTLLQQKQSAQIPPKMEAIYERCDRIADVLDRLGQQGSISPIEPKYEELVAYVGRLQERLDD